MGQLLCTADAVQACLPIVQAVSRSGETQLLAWSSLPALCPKASNNSGSNERIFMKFDISGFFEYLSIKFKYD
jgi:hypothetical protein